MERIIIKNGLIGWCYHNKTIWEGDALRVESLVSHNVYEGKVVFHKGCFSLKIEKIVKENYPEYDVGQIIPLLEFKI